MKRGYPLTMEEEIKIIEAVKFRNRSYNSQAIKYNISNTKVSNLIKKYNKRIAEESSMALGHKQEAYWDNEWCYGTEYNPVVTVRMKDLEKEQVETDRELIERLKVNI